MVKASDDYTIRKMQASDVLRLQKTDAKMIVFPGESYITYEMGLAQGLKQVVRSNKMKKLITLLAGCSLAFSATADILECGVTDKTENGRKLTPQQVEAGKYSYKLDNNDQKPKLTRCAYSGKVKKVVCSDVRIQRVGTEPSDQLKRFYYNNGRSNFHLQQGYSFKDKLNDKKFNFGICKSVKWRLQQST